LLRLRLLLLLLRACGTSCSQDIQDSVAVLLFFPPLLHLLLLLQSLLGHELLLALLLLVGKGRLRNGMSMREE